MAQSAARGIPHIDGPSRQKRVIERCQCRSLLFTSGRQRTGGIDMLFFNSAQRGIKQCRILHHKRLGIKDRCLRLTDALLQIRD